MAPGEDRDIDLLDEKPELTRRTAIGLFAAVPLAFVLGCGGEQEGEGGGGSEDDQGGSNQGDDGGDFEGGGDGNGGD